MTFASSPRAAPDTSSAVSSWHRACLWGNVPKLPIPTAYDEPTVMWRMSRGDGQSSHAVIDPRNHSATVLWFVNGHPLGVRDFADLTSAVRWCEQMRAQNWAAGWRPEAE